MAKILEVRPDIITIGMDDGQLLEVFPNELDFRPHVGETVEVYRSDDGDRIFVTKKEQFSFQQTNYNSSGSYQQTRSFDSYDNYGTNNYYPVVHGKYVNKWIYLIITFLFGVYGFQYFYSGKIKKGVLCFIFSWTGIPFILACIDFFKVLFKETDQNERIFIEHK